ncbi:dihydrofolate reductase [Corynebacterium anserum]|uniref:dihydrofolate reductase n=1 Tax=Corynebacterium anserum TaxID=2684406 RepID=A0A7G7YMB6_9CORY|nr:dihydrofolate reductase [Corynebacterium anserum]MBC2680994.1 dihydrofolate reductase [Corynebacterium anserum]QNH95636.1 dihydrofolate reductase [Corynebacterium anserum]
MGTSNNSSRADYPDLYHATLRQLIGHDVEVAMIWAQTTDRVIGDGTDMPWYLPEDLAHFKKSTEGYPVVMGRTSWEALEEPYQPLPKRENFVVTSDADYDAPGGHVHTNLPEAIAAAARWMDENRSEALSNTVWILGGGTVYQQCLPVADRIVVTEIEMTAPERFRVVAPEIPQDQFDFTATEWMTSRKGHAVDDAAPLRYRICVWTRKPQSS